MGSLDYRDVDRPPPDYSAKLSDSLSYRWYGQYEEIAFTQNTTRVSNNPCYVIVTVRSLLWTVLSILSALLVAGSVVTPQWLVGKPKWIGLRPEKYNGSIYEYREMTYNPTIGIFNRCTKIHQFTESYRHADHCGTYVTGFDMPSSEFPDVWKSTLILFSLAMILLGLTVITSLFSICVRSIFKKSIFTVSGLIQSISGLFLIVGLLIYPIGWGEDRVSRICGDHSAPFTIGDCSLGWAFYSCVAGTLMVFAAAVLSMQAETATSTDKIEDEIIKGKNLICVL